MQGPAPIPVFRPSYLTDGLEFQGNLVESPSNVFYQSVKASRASISSTGSGRFQFQWRSVSDNLLMSPTVMLRFRVRITSPVVWNQVLQYIAVRGVRAAKLSGSEAETYAADEATRGTIGPPAICFADGDAFTSVCSSINLSFNGTSLSLNRTNYFWRDYMRTQVSSDDAARIYKSAGGAYDANDAVGVCVPTYGADGAGNFADGAAWNTACPTRGPGRGKGNRRPSCPSCPSCPTPSPTTACPRCTPCNPCTCRTCTSPGISTPRKGTSTPPSTRP